MQHRVRVTTAVILPRKLDPVDAVFGFRLFWRLQVAFALRRNAVQIVDQLVGGAFARPLPARSWNPESLTVSRATIHSTDVDRPEHLVARQLRTPPLSSFVRHEFSASRRLMKSVAGSNIFSFSSHREYCHSKWCSFSRIGWMTRRSTSVECITDPAAGRARTTVGVPHPLPPLASRDHRHPSVLFGGYGLFEHQSCDVVEHGKFVLVAPVPHNTLRLFNGHPLRVSLRNPRVIRVPGLPPAIDVDGAARRLGGHVSVFGPLIQSAHS